MCIHFVIHICILNEYLTNNEIDPGLRINTKNTTLLRTNSPHLFLKAANLKINKWFAHTLTTEYLH